MRPGHWIGMAAWVVGMTLPATTVAAEPAAADTIAIHVRDYTGLNARELDIATRLAGEVFSRVGLHLVWPEGSARLATEDGLHHFDVVLLDAAMTERESPEPNVLAKASRTTKRARVYYPRVLARATATNSDPARVLAFVLAHEIGHLLLPEYSHSRRGIMQPICERVAGTLPGFTTGQAEMLRTVVREPGRQLGQ